MRIAVKPGHSQHRRRRVLCAATSDDPGEPRGARRFRRVRRFSAESRADSASLPRCLPARGEADCRHLQRSLLLRHPSEWIHLRAGEAKAVPRSACPELRARFGPTQRIPRAGAGRCRSAVFRPCRCATLREENCAVSVQSGQRIILAASGEATLYGNVRTVRTRSKAVRSSLARARSGGSTSNTSPHVAPLTAKHFSRVLHADSRDRGNIFRSCAESVGKRNPAPRLQCVPTGLSTRRSNQCPR